MALNYNTLQALTEKHVLPKIYDQIFEPHTCFSRIIKGGRTLKPAHGRSCEWIVEYAKTTATGTFSGYDVLETAPNETATRAELNWGGFYVSISLSGDDEDENAGAEQVVSLMEHKMDSAKKTLADQISTSFFSKGTDAKGIVGTRQAVCDSANAAAEGVSATYATIDRSLYSWFDANVTLHASITYANLILSTSGYFILDLWKRKVAECHKNLGGRKLTLIACSQAWYDAYEKAVTDKSTINLSGVGKTTDNQRADLGYQELNYKGIPILVDPYDPTNYCYFLNEDTIKWQPKAVKGFRMSEWKQPTDQLVKTAQVYMKGQLLLLEPRTCGVIIGDSTTLNY